MEFTGKNILIIDDDEDDFFITADYIKRIPGVKYDIEWSYTYQDALSRMIINSYDLYFVDYRMGAKTGVELIKEAKENGCEQPMILLTGKGNISVDIEAMQLGALDYLSKTDLNVDMLERSIRYALERAKNLRALRANERKFRALFEKSKDFIFAADLDLRFSEINSVAIHMLGYTKEQLLSKTLYDLIPFPQHRKFLRQTLIVNNFIQDWEVALQPLQGDMVLVNLFISNETFENGEEYLQGVIHDITNLKKAEKANLQTEKFAATGRLLRTLAHEVRNPLNNITLSLEQIHNETDLDETAELYLNIISRNCKRINDLITELLNSSKSSEIILRESILQNIMDGVIDLAIDKMTLKKISLKCDYEKEPVMVRVDNEKLQVALLNILVNAIEAIDHDKGEISMTMKKEGDTALITIKDNGCGISEENISRLFEPYFTAKRNGMGLGLASTLNIIKSHNGDIEVSSVPGEQTIFEIKLPIT